MCACWDKSLLPDPPIPFSALTVGRYGFTPAEECLELLHCYFGGLPGIQFKRKSPFSAVLDQISLGNRQSLLPVLETEYVRGSNWDVERHNFTALIAELFLQNMLDPEHLRNKVKRGQRAASTPSVSELQRDINEWV